MSLAATLAARLAALKEQNNTSVTSSAASTPTSIEVFIRLYNKAGAEGYIDYMRGAKALAAYLSPIYVPSSVPLVLPALRPRLIHSYELLELAKLLSPITGVEVNTLARVILYYTAKHILEGIE